MIDGRRPQEEGSKEVRSSTDVRYTMIDLYNLLDVLRVSSIQDVSK